MLKVSILILTHNAPQYVEETLDTLKLYTNKDKISYEVIVLDNASDIKTRNLLKSLKDAGGYIDKLIFSEENTLFAGGNNLAADASSMESEMLLLLNSDVRINNKHWLERLIAMKKHGNFGAASYGLSKGPDRADGYCFLIDRSLYMKYKLDEKFDWCWGLTKLQGNLLKDGHSILAISDHKRFILHHGGKSGDDWMTKTKGYDVSSNELLEWFTNSSGKVVVRSLSFLSRIRKVAIKIKQAMLELFNIN